MLERVVYVVATGL